MTAERTLRLVLFIAALLVLLLGLGSDAPYRQIEQLLQMPQSIHFTAMNKVLDNHYDTPIYQEWLRQMEEYLGVKLDITWKNLSYYNSQELIKKYMASGQFDDVFLAVDQNKINELGDAGLLVDVMAYPNQLPNYWQYLNDNYNFSYVSTQNGNIYGFAQGEIGTHCGNQRAFAYREDIFRRHRIKIPETLEEFYQAAKRLKKIYPQSYPVGGGRNDEPAYSVYSVFLNVNRTHYTIYYNGERYVLPPVDDGEQFYATLEFLHQMYAEGLIDPDFLTQTMEQGLERMENGRNFIVPNFWTGEIRNVNERSEDSSVCWCIAPRPRSYRNEVGWKMESQWEGYRLIPGDMAVISQKAENRELLIRLLDYQYSPQMSDLVNWGIEGLTYTGEGEERQFVGGIVDAPSPRAAAAQYGLLSSASCFPGIRPPKDRAAWSHVFPSISVWAQGEYFDYPDIWKFTYDYEHQEESVFPGELAPPIYLNPQERELRSRVLFQIETDIHENILLFITGKKSLDEYGAWRNHLLEMKECQKLLELLNAHLC